MTTWEEVEQHMVNGGICWIYPSTSEAADWLARSSACCLSWAGIGSRSGVFLNMTEAAKDRFIYLIICITPCAQAHKAHSIQSEAEESLTHRIVQVLPVVGNLGSIQEVMP